VKKLVKRQFVIAPRIKELVYFVLRIAT